MSNVEVLLKENKDLTSKMWRLHKELDEVKQLIKQNEPFPTFKPILWVILASTLLPYCINI